MKRFLSFLLQMKCSPKKIPRFLLNIVKNDVRSKTGFNLRMIMILLKKKHIDDIEMNYLMYAPVTRDDVWKVELVKEFLEVKHDELQLDNLSREEVDIIIMYQIVVHNIYILPLLIQFVNPISRSLNTD